MCTNILFATVLMLPQLTAVTGRERYTYLVCPDGSGDFVTIQDAIDIAADGDIIELCDATFEGPGNRNIDFHGLAITVRSEGGNPAKCIINCGGVARGFNFHLAETADSVVENIRICNGYATNGAGISCTNDAHPTITGCIISGNRATEDGGGVYTSSTIPMTGCTISGNKAEEFGGGLFGGGNVIKRNILWGNAAINEEGDDWYANGVGCGNLEDDACRRNCNCLGSPVEGLSDLLCKCVSPERPAGGQRFSSDPLFCDPGSWESAPTCEGNYYLRPGSPCADAASPCSGQIGALGVDCQACCLNGMANCIDTNTDDCLDQGGAPQEAGQFCTGTGPQACCLEQEGTWGCEMYDPVCCAYVDGDARGTASDCDRDENNNDVADWCEEACCFESGVCQDLHRFDCAAVDGRSVGPLSQCLGDADQNGIDDVCELPTIPTVSEWGMMAMAGVVLAAGALAFARRRRQAAS